MLFFRSNAQVVNNYLKQLSQLFNISGIQLLYKWHYFGFDQGFVNVSYAHSKFELIATISHKYHIRARPEAIVLKQESGFWPKINQNWCKNHKNRTKNHHVMSLQAREAKNRNTDRYSIFNRQKSGSRNGFVVLVVVVVVVVVLVGLQVHKPRVFFRLQLTVKRQRNIFEELNALLVLQRQQVGTQGDCQNV